ncbi:Rossmann fold nucleotide-binding protein [Actinobacillus pleuropneumoniae]|uniref:nucleotide 5'-monophosphate nucleosidase PpnN n=1 Tax=Actinobacillus TaxID=713 RepID=UPI000310929B|nr:MULTISPECIES: nucleotide 5'-monophosphate nucleosidase PpnN [Actinobacillus]UKH40378.1 LOG family protein [Actinobacillus pleuropneumoniae serovar 4 str. M62]WGE91509.1 nucleotide 5'-monophosphate nucleosidase PpnN [Actinobacillus genomosp. 1]SQF63870.1 Rossmann fold nucleotide-binding protein [Actinobacillus pleuropneumoniae]
MTVHCVNPKGSLDQLSHLEMELLTKNAQGNLYSLYRNCSLAVLNSGAITDDSRALLNQYPDFDINLLTKEKGVSLELHNPPKSAFVDGKMIVNIQYHLFAVLRDIVFVNALYQYIGQHTSPQEDNKYITNLVFSILRNAKALEIGSDPNLIVCWGGHSINQTEYQYCRAVGTELGLRQFNIVTGCGTGVMEAPMKGATIGHANQRYKHSRFIGITEPSIIASEPPNPIVTELIIMPDIEKRLEAFVRMGHGIVIFPGGPGTLEELLYILGVKLNPANKAQKLPVILTAPKESADYFTAIDQFIGETLGKQAQQMYEIIIDDPILVAQKMAKAMKEIKQQRLELADSYSFNWSLHISDEFTHPFEPTHHNMTNLNLHFDQPTEQLAANLRRAFSGIVAGNIKPATQDLIEQFGPFQLQGDRKLLDKIDRLLQTFITQHRMKLPTGEAYKPCYQILPNTEK